MSKPHHEDLAEEIAALRDDDDNINASKANGRFSTGGTETAEREGPGGERDAIDAARCAEWRRRLSRPQAEQQAIARRAGVDPCTVHYHARGKCDHEVDEPRVEGDQR